MPTVCSAYGCTYRHKKGDNIGMYCFPKNENLLRLWTVAVRRLNWKPTPASRICGKHFQSGKPSKDENHPDYVPNVFVFNKNQALKEHWQKVAEENASQRVSEILHGEPKVDVSGYRRLMPKVPFVIRAVKADSQPVNPAAQSCHFSTMMKKNNTGNRKAVKASNRNETLIYKEIMSLCPSPQSVPQPVWVLNFDSTKNSNVSVDKPKEVKNYIAPFISLKKNFPASVSDSSKIYEDNGPLYVESSMTISDDSTLTAESSIPASEDETTEPSMATNENAELDSIPSSKENSVTEDTTDSDYSEFKSAPFDTKEILAIKLETMLAVNISLKQKTKFYENRCRQYETEISNLKDTIKKLKMKLSV